MSDYLDTGNTRLLEDSVVEARRLAASLDSHAAQLRKSPDSLDALDEVFRCAHSLRAEAVAAGMGVLSELAGLIRDTAEALRSSQGAAAPDASVLIAEAAGTAARMAAGEQTDCGAISALLAEARDRAGRREVPRPAAVSLRVSSQRVNLALSAVAEAERAARALADTGQAPQSMLLDVREAIGEYRSTMGGVSRDIPGILESVRGGAAATDAARQISERFASVEALLASAEDRLGGAARALSASASACARAVRDIRDAVAGIRRVPLSVVYRTLVRKLGPRAGLEAGGGSLEVDASTAAVLPGILVPLLKSRMPHGRRVKGTPSVALSARDHEGVVVITVSGGRIGRPLEAKAARADAAEKVTGLGGTLTGARAIELRLPATPGVVPCLLMRAGSEVCAVPGEAVVECVSVTGSVTRLRRDGKDIPAIALDSTLSPSAPRPGTKGTDRAAVIVRSGRRLAGLVGDSHEGVHDIALAETVGARHNVAAVVGFRADGTPVRVLNVRRLVAKAHGRTDR